MKLVDHKSRTPEENIALDEVLLKGAEEGRIGETIRFWMSDVYFVVLGRSAKTGDECFVEECNSDGVRVIRRISGGGTVLQGPGCLNYSLVLSYDRDASYSSINASYGAILGDVSRELKNKGHDVSFLPVSDLALEGKKISGNAQARKRKYFLHHGTFLVDFDIASIGKYLKHPPKEPGYRQGRSHDEFLANIPVREEDLTGTLKEMFPVDDIWTPGTEDLINLERLVEGKYKDSAWNYSL